MLYVRSIVGEKDGRVGCYEIEVALIFYVWVMKALCGFSILDVNELYMWSRCAFDDVKISKGEKGGYSRLESV